ncbi:hypothetical protein L9F63_015387, partial [Diploptera punctata]
VAGLWSSHVEDSDMTSWPTTSQKDQKSQIQSDNEKHGKMVSNSAVSSTFKHGSYRKYMNNLIRSNFPEKLHISFPYKSSNILSSDNKRKKCNTDSCALENSKTNVCCSSNINKKIPLVDTKPITTVSRGVNENYLATNGEFNSIDSRIKSLSSLSREPTSGLTLLTTNRVNVDGGVVVDNKGDAPSRVLCFSSSESHPGNGAHAEVNTVCEKCNIREVNKGRQRKTGAIAINSTSRLEGPSYSGRAEGAVPASIKRASYVEKLVHKYTALIDEQRDRVLADKRRTSDAKIKSKKEMELPCVNNLSASQQGSPVPTIPNDDKDSEIVLNTSAILNVYDISHTNKIGREINTNSLYCEQQCDKDPVRYLSWQLGFSTMQLDSKIIQPSDGDIISEIDREISNSSNRILKSTKRGISDTPVSLQQINSTSDRYTETVEGREISRLRKTVSGDESEEQVQYICDSVNLKYLARKCQHSLLDCSDKKKSVDSSKMFYKQSTDEHVGGIIVPPVKQNTSHSTLLLPHANKRSISPAISSSASDEGFSVAPPLESSLTPCSSEDDFNKLSEKTERKSEARWTWPILTNDQENECQGRLQRSEHGRCGSSDSAVCLLPNDEENRLLKYSGNGQFNVLNLGSDNTSCDKSMMLDRYMNKNSPLSDDSETSQYFWSDRSSSKENRRDSDVFESVSRQNSVDLGRRGDVWFEEMRNIKETVCDGVCDRDSFLNSAGDSCWDVRSTEAKNDDAFDLKFDRNRFRPSLDLGQPDDGLAFRHKYRHHRKLKSMISCESGVVEDDDCSRKSSTVEPGENAEDEYPVELRRQSTQSYQTDDDDSSANHSYRNWRTPSVVVSDYSDDIPYFTSLTLEEIEQLGCDDALRRRDFSSSECGSVASSVSSCGNVSALDAEYALRTPERKASDCSTCSTLSGDEDASCDALLQPVRTKQK